jgi:quinol monooxygenase YgiN
MVSCNLRDPREAKDGGKGHGHRVSSRQAGQGEGVARGAACCLHTEKGCINYDLHESPDQPGVLVFLENWESKADLEAHLASPHIDDFRRIAPDLLAEPPDITLWREIKG